MSIRSREETEERARIAFREARDARIDFEPQYREARAQMDALCAKEQARAREYEQSVTEHARARREAASERR